MKDEVEYDLLVAMRLDAECTDLDMEVGTAALAKEPSGLVPSERERAMVGIGIILAAGKHRRLQPRR